jgi:glycine reductase
VDVYAPYTYIVPTGNTAATLRAAVPALARLALKLGRGEPLGPPGVEGYLPRGLRRNVFVEQTAAQRAVRLLLRKLAGEPYESELRVPVYDKVPPAPALADLRQAALAVGTEGGTVPVGNPDRLEHVRATHWHRYSVAGLPALLAGQFESAHGGYDARFANADPNRMVPLDSLRDLERGGAFERLDDYMYVTVGCGMPIARAAAIGQSIAEEMKSKGIHGMIMTAT